MQKVRSELSKSFKTKPLRAQVHGMILLQNAWWLVKNPQKIKPLYLFGDCQLQMKIESCPLDKYKDILVPQIKKINASAVGIQYQVILELICHEN